MKRITFFLLLLLSVSCRHSSSSETETGNVLKKVFQSYLYKGINNDSSKAKYFVQKVIFFEGEKFYDCEFTVRMIQSNLDTTGIMTAMITKDFLTVKRKY